MKCIGFVGTNGAGKTFACEYLIERGYSQLSLSDIVRLEARKRGLSLERENLIAIGSELKKNEGDAVLAKKVFELASDKGYEKVVFDSIRHEAEVQFLKEQGTKIIGINASVELRYQRIQERKRETDRIDFETFKKQDEHEINGLSYGQNIGKCLDLCDSIIINDGGIEQFFMKLEKVLGLEEQSNKRGGIYP